MIKAKVTALHIQVDQFGQSPVVVVDYQLYLIEEGRDPIPIGGPASTVAVWMGDDLAQAGEFIIKAEAALNKRFFGTSEEVVPRDPQTIESIPLGLGGVPPQ